VPTRRRKYLAADCKPVTESMLVYRYMQRDSMDPAVLAEELMSDEEAGDHPDGRARKYPVLMKGRSLYRPERAALRRWRRMLRGAEERGEQLADKFIAELRIGPDEGFCVEEKGKQGHLVLWGDNTQLAAKVVRVFEGSIENEQGGAE
jgi:hypothetical protein